MMNQEVFPLYFGLVPYKENAEAEKKCMCKTILAL